MTTNAGPRPRFWRLSPEVLAAKQGSGECYYCPEKYAPGHRCHGKGAFLLELDDDHTAEEVADELAISLHALTAIDVADTMKLQVVIAGVPLTALVDTGSTHTFFRDSVACQLGLTITPCRGLSVKVANGDRVANAGICIDTALHIDGEDFVIDCYQLPLAGFDVVLGVHWLRTLGPILWNFEALTLSFWRHGRTVRWTGIGGTPARCVAISSSRELLEALLSSFADIFEEPRGLPPPRRHDHRIHLMPNAAPVAVRPYRYPQLLKDEIEKQCDDMLA